MTAAALLLLCATLAAEPATEPRTVRTNAVRTNDVLASLEQQDAAAYYVAQAPSAGGAAARPSLDTTAANSARRPSAGNPYARLSRVPNMFGDSLAPNGFISITGNNFIATGQGEPPSGATAPILIAGGGRYLPIGENNKPIPVDRVFFLYNGFNNAVTSTNRATGQSFDGNIQRYTFGLEKTFFDKWASIEIRMPLTNSFSFTQDDVSGSGGNMGNLNLIYKQLLVRTEEFALATGVGLGLPTGSSFKGDFNEQIYQLGNNAVYVLPYIGAAYTGDNNFFAIAYAQLDIAASGDRFTLDGERLGTFNAPTFARFDLSGGYWLLRDTGRPYLAGLALVTELHYVTSLTDSDRFTATSPLNGSQFGFNLNGNRFDFLNTTLGMHWQITDVTNFRIGGVFPVNPAPHRQFDSELQMSFNRMF